MRGEPPLDVYGRSPILDALPNVKILEEWTDRALKSPPKAFPTTVWTLDMMFALAMAAIGGTLLGVFGIGVYELARYGVPYLDRTVSAWFQ